MTTREEQLEQRIAQLEVIVLRAAAQAPQLPPAPPQTIIEATPATPPKRKPKAKAAPPPDITPVVQLQAVDGALSPLNAVLRECKATQKSVQGIAPLCSLDDVLSRANVKPSIGVKAENVRRAWSTIFHFRAEDDEGLDVEQAREDLLDFKKWAKDPLFVRALNTDPTLAVAWFIDVLLATNGDLED
jgi:hypothetical protein